MRILLHAREFLGETAMGTITSKDILNHDATRFALLLHAYKECSAEVQDVVNSMTEIIVDEHSDDEERMHAADALVEALFPALTTEIRAIDEQRMASPAAVRAREDLDRQEDLFATRLRDIMKARNVTQEQLAARIGVGQPAISNMLNRKCRPQQKTIARIAEALDVPPEDLWPQ